MSDIPEYLASALADRYVLEREIGAGGMATVYLARDLRHKRSVAIKVVRPELGGREGVDRFLREIELAARLQHPHILPVFDSGAVAENGASVPYFVMPFVEGETLRQRLQREKRLPVQAAATLGAEVADALAYAHTHGVVHRDIKPENILLSGGHAVVADFGVARALEQGTGSEQAQTSRLTRAGLAVGTPLYMSPEQATGESVDPRSDQYSLATVLYEMLSGEPPFTGPTNQAVIAKSISAARPHVTRARPEVPPQLEQVLLRAMALDPAERFADMAAMGAALRATQGAPSRASHRRAIAAGAAALLAAAAAGGWLATRSSGHRVASAAETLAVLPFHASGPGVEFLGEGMMDLLATNLRGVGGITTVDPRAVLKEWGSAQAAGSDDLTRALRVGRDLDAGSVVLGSAVRTGGRVRVAADLYSIDGDRLGRAQVDGPADSVLAVVDRLSLALLRDVWRSKEPIPNVRLASLTTDSIDALRSYLQGERYYRRLEWDSALPAYTRAVETDSTFALAHLRRAQVFGWTGGYGNQESNQAVAAGVRFANRLPPRDRRLLVGFQLFDQGKPSAIDSLRAFVRAYPGDVEGWYLLGESMFHIHQYRPDYPDSVSAVFDSVLSRDSTLFPALLHPLDLALLYRDSVRYNRYVSSFQRTAPPGKVAAIRTAAATIWGPQPTDRALLTALREQASWVIDAALSSYQRPDATSDSVLRLFTRVQDVSPRSPAVLGRSLSVRAHALAGTGRWREARIVLDSLRTIDLDKARGIQAWAVALGLTPSGLGPRLDSAVAAEPPGAEAEYARAMVHVLRGQVAEGRRLLARALAAKDSAAVPLTLRGLMIAGEGWAALLQGDSVGGIRRMRAGLDLSAASDEESAFPRLQLALALAARPDTREEGIRWLKYGFETLPLYKPLTLLALGHTYELAGQADSAAWNYRRFLRLWDKADPELQGRVRETREALEELLQEKPNATGKKRAM
jgi:TolB-like protein/tetratricopeptide (TPR) repeat protein